MSRMQTMSDCEDDYAYEARALPTPTDTPYRTPSNSASRQSLHRRDSLPEPSSSPPPFPPENGFFSKEEEEVVDVASNENISPLDPRRFTPTLHASLVSEILSLRRDLESKSKTIDSLELSLDDARTENESLNETLSKNLKEGRSVKRQLQLVEGGNLSALTELSKERDEALDNISDVRKRLEQAQKRVRTHEEEVERTQMLWERDKQNWDGERRNFERKIHVVEGRLKAVLNEVAAAQAANPYPRSSDGDFNETSRGSMVARGSDTTSIRSNSITGRRRTSTTSVSTHDGEPNGLRYSVMSMASGYGTKLDGLNLADELAFDEEEEDNVNDDDDNAPYSPEALPEERPISSQSRTMGLKARKLLGLSVDVSESVETPVTLDESTPVERMSGYVHESYPSVLPRVEYADVGIQYSPPPSPALSPQIEDPLAADFESQCEERNAIDRDRDASVQVSIPDNQDKEEQPKVDMVSISCQTVGELPSPPWTPKLEDDTSAIRDAERIPMSSVATQTDEPTPQRIESAPESDDPDELHMFVPTIAIHPPGSGPSSPRNSVVLPPQTKNASCQTDLKSGVEVRSSAMQTEEIRIDRRPVKLPASLLPSAIPDQPKTSETADTSEPPIPPYRPPPPRSSRRKLRSPPVVEPPSVKSSKGKQPEKAQAYPGNNDNGPLAEEERSPEIRRPFRSSSLFAGFENNSQDELPEIGVSDAFNDDDIFNRPMVSCTIRSGRMVTKPSPSVLDDNPLREMEEPDSNAEDDFNDEEIPSGSHPRSQAHGKSSNESRPPRSSKLASGSKQKDIRRTAMISSGTAAHQSSRPRSPSAPSIWSAGSSTTAAKPPFPVPIRLSSRKVPTSASDGAQSPTPYSNGNYSSRTGRQLTRQPTLRKVRSAAAVARGEEQDRPPSRSPPPTLSASSAAPDSPQLPPMPIDEITAPRRHRTTPNRRHRPAPSKAYSHSRDNSTATSVQQTSVVDAIAQTMVGEWMWKYVRKRKSFGVPDSSRDNWDVGKSSEEVSANITGNGVRHKRWVWIAPYERAVMWSSKQPVSGNALMGKNGRKLTIQSVLDVKDDNPMPKGANPQNQFNRSILILTPQRALKFTAMTVERHYIWLTALSFLSHSAIGANDLATLPPVPQQNDYMPPPPPPQAALRRNPIRDSIRVAKSKPRSAPNNNRNFTAHASPVPELPMGEVDGSQPIAEAASPPNVPRHSRKRSNTAPRAPPSAFRSFSNHNSNHNSNHGSNHAPKPSTYSATTNGSSDIYAPSSSVGAHGVQSGQSSFSRRTSEASGPSSVGMNNFFDAVGTVRMEAFIDRTEMARQRGAYRSRAGGKRRDPSYWPQSPDTEQPLSENGSEIYFRHDDPFRGF